MITSSDQNVVVMPTADPVPSVPIVFSDQPRGALTPMDLIDRALASGAGMEVIGKMMDYQERYERNQARKAFDAAIAAAKAEIPVIVKNRSGHNTRYADFAAIARAVDPILGQHGLSYRFRTSQNGAINVTCILSHNAGHSEENTLSAAADTSGAKNAIQSIGSTLTYLQRYSLVQALGLAASDDDDGRASSDGTTITDEQREIIQAAIVHVAADLPRFLRYFKIESLEDMPAARFQDALNMLKRKAQP